MFKISNLSGWGYHKGKRFCQHFSKIRYSQTQPEKLEEMKWNGMQLKVRRF